MNIKKSFKVLTTATLISALSLSTVIPGAAQAADKTVKTKSTVAQKATQVEKIVVKTADGKTYVVGSSDYSQMKAAGLLNGATVQGVVSQEGKYYSNSEFAQAKAASEGDVAKAFELLSTEGTALTTTPVGEITGVDEDGKFIVDEITPPATDEDLKVVEISAINATDANFTVKFGSDVTEADLKDAKLNLKGAQDLTASFVKLDGKTATYKVDTDIVGKSAYNGEYTVSSTALKLPANLKTTYTAEIAGTFVEGFVFSPVTTNKVTKDTALEGATVTVDGKSTTTDAKGYYKLAVTPGAKKVEISKGTEYFVAEATANVARNNSTVVNEDLEAVETSKLYFTGTVLDNADSSAVENATVQLQAKNEKGEWENVSGDEAKTTTDNKGQFQFGNTKADKDKSGAADANNLKKDILEVGKEYRAVVEKKVSKTNLTSVYKKQEVDFTVSNKKPETTKLVNVEKVAELQGLTVDAAVLNNDANANTIINDTLKVSFLDTDAVAANELAEFTLTAGTDFTLNADKKSFKEGLDLVKAGQFKQSGDVVKPRLVSGTYFMVVENTDTDSTTNPDNAKKAYAVEVTEGGNVTVKYEIEKANAIVAKTSAAVHYVKSVFPKADTNETVGTVTELTKDSATTYTSGDSIKVNYEAYQTVAGKQILIATGAPAATIDATGSDASKAKLAVDDINLKGLAASVDYTMKPTSDFLTGLSTKTVKPIVDGQTYSADVLGATKIKTVTLKDETGTPLASNITVKSLKLVDASGKTVVEVSPDKKVLSTDLISGKLDLTKLDSENTTDVSEKFTQLTPGKYKLTAEVEGYKAGTSLETELIDFENGNVEVKVEKIKTPVVTGYVRFADDQTNVAVADAAAEATIIAYDKNGDAVDATDFGTTTGTADTTYKLTKLKAGQEYTFVVRGKGFETKAIKKTVTADEINALNFDVVRGGDGQFKLQIVDTKNNNIDNTKVNYAVKDAYANGDKDLGVEKDNSIGLSAVTFDGEYEVTKPAPGSTGTASRSYTIDSVSVGSYTLELAYAGTNDKYVLPQTYNLTLANINGTSYSTSDGKEIVKVPLLNDNSTGALDVALNLTFTGTAVVTNGTAPADIDYIQVIDKDGNIVDTKRGNNAAEDYFNDTLAKATTTIKVPNNATYTIKTYLDNGFVTTDTVTVQNNDVSKTINVEQSKR